MARFHTLPRCPLAVQFWLPGLDARRGDLTRLGHRKTSMPTGSSAYTLEFVERQSLTLYGIKVSSEHLLLPSPPAGLAELRSREGRCARSGVRGQFSGELAHVEDSF
jgi:hypothetical protein